MRILNQAGLMPVLSLAKFPMEEDDEIILKDGWMVQITRSGKVKALSCEIEGSNGNIEYCAMNSIKEVLAFLAVKS